METGCSRPSLSAIEVAILNLIADGFQSKEIASQLGRARPTVEGHVRLLCAKFRVQSRTHLISVAYRAGILAPATFAEKTEIR